MVSRISKTQRNSRGSILVEGCAGLIMVAMVTMLGLALLMDIGTLVCYKIKLNAIADATAQYAADQSYWLGAQRPAAYFTPDAIQNISNQVCVKLLKDEGLFYGSSLTVQSDPSNKVCVVTLQANNLPLPFPIGPLPPTINDTEIAAVPYPNDTPISTLALNWSSSTPLPAGPPFPGSTQTVLVPCYGMSAGNVPGYTNINTTFGGTPPSTGAHNPYPGSNFPFWATGVYSLQDH